MANELTKFEATSYCKLSEGDVQLMRRIAEDLEAGAYRSGFLRACMLVGIDVEIDGK